MFNKLSQFFTQLFKKQKTQTLITWMVTLSMLFLFFYKGYLTIDPDFGWYLRVGQIISTSGIPKTDPLSYTMGSYPYIDHGWLSHAMIYLIYNHLGKAALALLYAIIPVLAMLILVYKADFKWRILLLLMGTVLLLQFAGIRTQVEDWLFMAVLLKVILNQKLWQKWRNITPLIFLLWANFHGGFIIGVGIIGFATIAKFWVAKRIDLHDLTILVLSLLATLINPYGIRLYHEVFQTFSDSVIRQTIDEWEPIWTRYTIQVRLAATFFGLASAISLFLYRKKITLVEFGLFAIFLLTAVTTKRDIPVFAIVALPILVKTLPEMAKKLDHKPQILSALIIATILIFAFQTFYLIHFSYNSMEDFRYPKQLVGNLKTAKFKGNIFTDYGWGGYLDWKIPDHKVFIDGRMPSWKWDSAPPNETNYAFGEYRQVFEQANYQPIFKKYNIQTVIWPTGLFQSGDTPDNGVAWISKDVLIANNPLLLALKKDGWKLVYVDYITVVYEAP